MRIPAAVLRRLSAGIFVLVLLLIAVVPVLADTGTYGISSYIVTLEPRDDGRVKLDIEQTWKVHSGSIPWVTVGLPNSHFSIEDHGADVRKISKDNSGGFTGVRIDLDKDYQPGETFKIEFTVLQENLLERLPSEEIWRINYTPGWYDRATIDHMKIRLVSPVHTDSYKTLKPGPANIIGNTITWERSNISPGGKFNIIMESTDGRFLKEGAGTVVSTNGDTGGFPYGLIIFIVFVVLLVVLYFWLKRRKTRVRLFNEAKRIEAEMAEDEKKKLEYEAKFKQHVKEENLQPDEQGRYRDKKHGYITPALWAAIIYNRSYHPYVGPHIHTGGTTRPSCVSCACVSCACACACACAGGGAAGCSRKTIHECRACMEMLKKQKEIVDA